MCGITGFWCRRPRLSADAMQATVAAMSERLNHRGPDDAGTWIDEHIGLALGHRRLSILDLSPAGHQPMMSASGRFVIVFNGEIYNFQELKAELEAHDPLQLRGHSDTEVALYAFERWGAVDALRRFNGMFALALWDRREHLLTLARDRFGEKPLYYGWCNGVLLFGSELKALCVFPGTDLAINRDALALYMRHNCVPAPYTIYRGMRKLLPGTFLTITPDLPEDVAPQPFWTLRDTAERGLADPFRGSEAEALEQLDSLLRDSVRLRMIADVPLGSFLSGGLDSSTITALMQAQSGIPVKTFTLGIEDAAYDEAASARAVAQHLHTDQTEVYVTPQEAIALIAKLPSVYDEPFADSSQIPTMLVAQLARRYVTVALSGDSGDEIFGGYNRHLWAGRVWNSVGWLPTAVRCAVAAAVRSIRPELWDKVFHLLSPLLPRAGQPRLPGYKLHKLAGVLGACDLHAMYVALASHWSAPSRIVLGAQEPSTPLTDPASWPASLDASHRMMFLDTLTYLPDDILTKVDRATMSVGLECRVPFLDHRVVEFAWRLPLTMKFAGGQGKWLLRKLLRRHLPRELFERPKMGFGVPLGAWLRGPLRDWAEALLDESRLRQEGVFAPAPIRELWREHLAGRGAWQFHLWDVLMFQSWLEYTRVESRAHAEAVV
ncbi:MAG: asparagine synthase (glutamine-hydrolyzing) [Terriglobales bacterium]